MFTIYFTNMGRGLEAKFSTLKAAYEQGKKHCFEFTVSDQYGIVLAWSPIGGRREYRAIRADGELRQDSPR
jgi:hypothetical protein